jgi:type III pantothenate kinase
MLLAVDIGNTNISLGLFKGKRLTGQCSIPTKAAFNLRAHCESQFPSLRGAKRRGNLKKIIIVSVVPGIATRFTKTAKKVFKNARVSIVGKDLKVPLKNQYNKSQIGQDRLVTAYAATKLFGTPCLIVDFGTAVTFDAVSARNVYLGGLILPGIKMSLASLYSGTSLLPKVVLKKAQGFIGKNTKQSIVNGMVYGYGSVCDGLVAHFRKQLGKKLQIVATGGDARLISKYTSSIKKINPSLSLQGLAFLSTHQHAS